MTPKQQQNPSEEKEYRPKPSADNDATPFRDVNRSGDHEYLQLEREGVVVGLDTISPKNGRQTEWNQYPKYVCDQGFKPSD